MVVSYDEMLRRETEVYDERERFERWHGKFTRRYQFVYRDVEVDEYHGTVVKTRNLFWTELGFKGDVSRDPLPRNKSKENVWGHSPPSPSEEDKKISTKVYQRKDLSSYLETKKKEYGRHGGDTHGGINWWKDCQEGVTKSCLLRVPERWRSSR